jgi:hypothetical protein
MNWTMSCPIPPLVGSGVSSSGVIWLGASQTLHRRRLLPYFRRGSAIEWQPSVNPAAWPVAPENPTEHRPPSLLAARAVSAVQLQDRIARAPRV